MRRGARRVVLVVEAIYSFVADWIYVAFWQLYGLLTSDDTRQYLTSVPERETAVVMIPGVYEPWRFMKPLNDLLHENGYHVYVVAGLGYNTGKIPDMAEIVHRFVEELETDRVVIVAHSKGGLIGKYLLANYNDDGRVRHVVAINSPFEGSIYANFAPVHTVRMFSTRDAVITKLRLNREVNTHITSIYSVYDPNIPKGSRLDGATNISVDVIGHFRIISSPKLHEKLLQVLERVDAGAAPHRRAARTTGGPEVVKGRNLPRD
jgi:triacylglycerol lipase